MGALEEIEAGERFAFGANWQRFARDFSPLQRASTKSSLADLLGLQPGQTLAGETFLDIGCGSGASSLAALDLGAEVLAFDYDEGSCATAEALISQRVDSTKWRVLHGSALDAVFLESLGRHSLVHSWGVLHHTGHMWEGIDLACRRVSPGGRLVIALYNDQGLKSHAWRAIKRLYNANRLTRIGLKATFYPLYAGVFAYTSVRDRRNSWRQYHERRGMSPVADWRDWLGGLPFEVARPEEVDAYLSKRGFEPERTRLTKRLGCNEFVYRRVAEEA